MGSFGKRLWKMLVEAGHPGCFKNKNPSKEGFHVGAEGVEPPTLCYKQMITLSG